MQVVPVDRLLPSIGLIAKRTQAPVQTVLIQFSTPYLGKAWPLWRPPSLPLQGRVRLGERFDPPSDPAAFNEALQRHFDQALGGHGPACAQNPPPCPTHRPPTSS